MRKVVIDLKVRRNQPQCSNFALNIRTRQSHYGSCRSKGGRCRRTNGNSSYIFSAEKYAFIIKYSKAWKWCRTFSANFFDLNVRHLTCLRSFCVEHSGHLPKGMEKTIHRHLLMHVVCDDNSHKVTRTYQVLLVVSPNSYCVNCRILWLTEATGAPYRETETAASGTFATLLCRACSFAADGTVSSE
jgi:hypothetical protein